MSYYAPTNWAEVIRGIEAGHTFRARSLNIVTESAGLVCGHYSTRAMLTGNGDNSRLAREIVASNDAVHARYMDPNGTGRSNAVLPEDFVYFVLRDGKVIAALRKNGTVETALWLSHDKRRIGDALERIIPALRRQAARLAVSRAEHDYEPAAHIGPR